MSEDKILTWGEFVTNVYEWSKARKILEQATIETQIIKTFEKIGEYVTAKTEHEKQDAIGDIAVCLVNCMLIGGRSVDVIFGAYGGPRTTYPLHMITPIADCCSALANGFSLKALRKLGLYSDFLVFCTRTWNEIKDRRGMMVDGFYVKWDNLTEDQKKEAESLGI